jgi:predicted nucleic acid-binding protein
MPIVYADTSALFAFFHPRDEFSWPLARAVERYSPDFAYWSFARFELRHNLRQARVDSYGEIAWQALRSAERTQARLRWNPDLKCESLLESADELSAQHAIRVGAGSSDFLHIAAAKRLQRTAEITAFWTCDQAQADAANVAGLKTRLFSV